MNCTKLIFFYRVGDKLKNLYFIKCSVRNAYVFEVGFRLPKGIYTKITYSWKQPHQGLGRNKVAYRASTLNWETASSYAPYIYDS